MGTRLNRLTKAVLTSNQNLCFEPKYEKYQSFYSEKNQFFEVKFSIYKRVFLMFVEPRGTILTILEKEHKKSISMKIFLNRTTGLEEHFCQIILKLGH